MKADAVIASGGDIDLLNSVELKLTSEEIGKAFKIKTRSFLMISKSFVTTADCNDDKLAPDLQF
jgi:hypothetical protein